MAFDAYLSVLIFLGVGVFLSLFLLCISWWRSKHKPYAEKQSPYECGFDAFDAPDLNARGRFNIQYYLVAILFIIFDVEIAFLFPWAVSLGKIGVFGFWSMMIFLGVLTIGFFYEWKKGALNWE